MPSIARTRPPTRLGLAVFLASGLAGCAAPTQQTELPAPSILNSATASSPLSAAPVEGGTITLTDTGCRWDAPPASMTAGRVTIGLRNETNDHGVFIVHELHAGRTWSEGQAAIAEIQEALKTGEDWPPAISEPIGEAGVPAGGDGMVSAVPTAGTVGVVCSANTSPTGDILSVFLVGPLEVGAT
jgi:hypothetical protein